MAFRPYLSIVHHVPGRIRLRFERAALGRLGAGRLGAFANAAHAAGAVRSLRVNAAARSVAIEYDPVFLPPVLWTTFLEGDEEEAAVSAARLAAYFVDPPEAFREQPSSKEGTS